MHLKEGHFYQRFLCIRFCETYLGIGDLFPSSNYYRSPLLLPLGWRTRLWKWHKCIMFWSRAHDTLHTQLILFSDVLTSCLCHATVLHSLGDKSSISISVQPCLCLPWLGPLVAPSSLSAPPKEKKKRRESAANSFIKTSTDRLFILNILLLSLRNVNGDR